MCGFHHLYPAAVFAMAVAGDDHPGNLARPMIFHYPGHCRGGFTGTDDKSAAAFGRLRKIGRQAFFGSHRIDCTGVQIE
jgi:hypothetical protein